MRPSAYKNRAHSSPNVTGKRSILKRRPSVTYDAELPRNIPTKDVLRLPAVPSFEVPVKCSEIVEGDNAQFDCKIRGNPRPDICWYKNGQLIDYPTDRIWAETSGDGKHKMIVENASLEDRGTYRCTIVNRLGRTSSATLLNIHASPAKKTKHQSYEIGVQSTNPFGFRG
ncbi:unnamed protein product [Clavelina lepadiformis]|uniref:Ig-like domain-containing protein n=1 Tax=Clavelina lepadiformis TaxID=159417 RepID=A0ABP0F253_CLALP